jgi:hypothetical protein
MGRRRTSRRDIKITHIQPVRKGKNIKGISWVTLIIGVIIAFGVAYYYFVRAERRTQHSINFFQTHGKYPEQQKSASILE